jgi:luciferase family oxidoreductase group 1
MPGIASAATAVVIGHVAAGTSTIRVGSGGVMLPNHAPLMVAEAFGTLAALHPGRIDLGLGRAPGTDQRTMRALRRYMGAVDSFAQDVVELQGWFQPAQPGQSVRAVPGEGQDVPLWLLGSSTYSAQLAAALGLPFAFAAHFAPDQLMEAIAVYRRTFKPSQALAKPYVLVCIGVCAADTDDEARRLFTSSQQQFLALRRGNPGLLPPPVDDIRDVASESPRSPAWTIPSAIRRSARRHDPRQDPEGARRHRRRRADGRLADPRPRRPAPVLRDPGPGSRRFGRSRSLGRA